MSGAESVVLAVKCRALDIRESSSEAAGLAGLDDRPLCGGLGRGGGERGRQRQ